MMNCVGVPLSSSCIHVSCNVLTCDLEPVTRAKFEAVCVCVCVCVFIYAHTHTHMHIHIHI